MNHRGPVIIIEDDEDDQFFFKEAFEKLNYPNEVIFFSDGLEALNFLTTNDVSPFLIISDINMPKLNGLELHRKLKMDAALNLRCIPYLFFSTAVEQQAVIEAYSLSVQGFFLKQNKMDGLEKTIASIMDYWLRCASPNSFV